MNAVALAAVETDLEAIEALERRLGAASNLGQMLDVALEWLNERTPVDVLAVALIGSGEPAGFAVTNGIVDADGRDAVLMDLQGAAARLSLGACPRRTSDIRLWSKSDSLHAVDEPLTLVGQWTVQLAGEPAALVRVSRFAASAAVEHNVVPLLGAAARLLGLHVCAAAGPGREVDLPQDECGFEDLFERAVQHARQSRTPVSLMLIEVEPEGQEIALLPTDEQMAEVEEAARTALRHRDPVCRIRDDCVAVVLPRTDSRGALVAADRIQRALREQFRGHSPTLSFHVGIGGRDPEETEAGELFARAAQAVAQARFAHSEAAFVYV